MEEKERLDIQFVVNGEEVKANISPDMTWKRKSLGCVYIN